MNVRAYERYYAEVVHDVPEWVHPAKRARTVLARVYRIECVINGVPAVDYEMTAWTQLDAVQRLKERYKQVHGVEIETGAVTPLAFAEAYFDWSYDREAGVATRTGHISPSCYMAPSAGATDQHQTDLDYGYIWAKPFAAAARRLATGKSIEPRQVSGAPPRIFAGWPFLHARKVLRQDRGRGFEVGRDFLREDNYKAREPWSSIFPPEYVDELPQFLVRLKALGILVQSGSLWRVTTRGRKVRAMSQGRINREAALAEVERLVHRIGAINANQTYCYKVAVAVLFGSVLDSGKKKVGDVDLAVELVPRASGEDLAYLREAAEERCPETRRRKWMGRESWPQDEVEQAIIGPARGILQLRRVSELESLFQLERKEPAYRVLYGTWASPQRTRRRERR